eukprot:Lankesteria_metandrocarpae@DN3982_c0_g1_i2.p1
MSRLVLLTLAACNLCVVLVEGLTAEEMVKIGQPGRVGRPLPSTESLTTLVISDDDTKSRYSSLFSDLTNSRHRITFVDLQDLSDISVVNNEVKVFDNIILLVVDATELLYKSSALNHEVLTDFVNEYNGSLLTAGGRVSSSDGTSTARVVRSLANNFGVDFDSEGTKVFDMSGDKMLNALPLITSHEVVNSSLVWSKPSEGVVFSGMGMLIGEEALNYTFPILSAASSHYSAATRNSKPIATGSGISLVSAFQGLREGRATFFGSFSMCSDEVFVLHPANRLFCFQTALWTFQQSGVLRWSDLEHREIGATEASYLYRHSSEMEFQVDLWINAKNGAEWVPYRANDVQLEYTMLDPYIRQFLLPPTEPDSATYKLQFKAPDKTGIFKFVIQYCREGLSNIHIETLAPIRHMNTGEHERFTRNAYPYYASCLTGLVCFFAFVLFFTFHKPAVASKSSTDKKDK